MPYVPKILVVDDEPRMCSSLKVLLDNQGYETKTCHNGNDAIGCLAAEYFDLVLLDIVMPDMTGHQIMDHINTKHPDTLVIVMTGHASIESAVEALRRWAYDYLRKPFDLDLLLKRVGNAVDQKRLQRENKAVNGKLEIAESRYRFLVNASPDIIYMLDPAGNFTFVNGTAANLLGYKENDLIGRHYSSLIFEHDMDKARFRFNERRTGDRAMTGVELTLKCSHSDGPKKYITVELRSMGMYDKPVERPEKRFVGTYGVARDVTERKRLEAQLLQAQKMEAVGALSSGIAHDFNNLLMGIGGRASLMFLDIDSDHSHFEHLKGIEEMVKMGSNLTRQLLGFARGSRYEVRPTDLNEIIEKSIDMFGRTKKEITIHTKYQKDIWIVDADHAQIQQVLLNLYVNAWQAMPGGGNLYIQTENVDLREKDVRHFGAKPGRFVKVGVTDTGIGMDEKTQQRIFEPFFSTREMGRGTGLGLASAYGIVKNHGGIINVYSKRGGGATFDVFLPATGACSRADLSHGEGEQDLKVGQETILFVDDEKTIIEVGEQMLLALGYKVLLARGGREAVEICKESAGDIDMVILDMIMPDMGGGEVYDALKKMNPNVKVLLSSGYSSEGQANEILERGCKGFIQKPFSMAQLSREVRRILED